MQTTPRGLLVALTFAVAALVGSDMAKCHNIDLDVFHEMALAREARSLGFLPSQDSYAFTPTVDPIVHHEWLTGVAMESVTRRFGAGGLVGLRYAVFGAMLAVAVVAARRFGAKPEAALLGALVAMMPLSVGYSLLRAQAFTLLGAAIVWWGIAEDRAGRRGWMAVYALYHVAWLNLHAGFVVGSGLLALHFVERLLERQPGRHLLPLAGFVAASALVLNPYGTAYIAYLAHGLTMPRPMIGEWAPLWKMGLLEFFTGLVMLAAAVAAMLRLGWRDCPGWLPLAACFYQAFAHQRHLSLLAIAWFVVVPAWWCRLGVAEAAAAFLNSQRRFAFVLAGVCVLAGMGRIAVSQPFSVVVPDRPDPELGATVYYPVGAVRYLAEQGFQGRLMTSYNAGSYVSWNLSPEVKISLDSRYEVAYRPGVLEEVMAFYLGEAGGLALLDKYPDATILIEREAKGLAGLEADARYSYRYQDDSYLIFQRLDGKLPLVDRRGERFVDPFPTPANQSTRSK